MASFSIWHLIVLLVVLVVPVAIIGAAASLRGRAAAKQALPTSAAAATEVTSPEVS